MSARIDKDKYIDTIRDMRKERMTDGEIALAIGVSRPTVLKWMKEEGMPTGRAMFCISDRIEKRKQNHPKIQKSIKPKKNPKDFGNYHEEVWSHEEIVARYGEVGQYASKKPFTLDLF